jgi:hypothetical protein
MNLIARNIEDYQQVTINDTEVYYGPDMALAASLTRSLKALFDRSGIEAEIENRKPHK